MAVLQLSLLMLRLAGALRVGYEMQTSRRLTSLQDFGSRGGQVVTDLTLSVPGCSNETHLCDWARVHELYLVVLSTDQLYNMTRTFSHMEHASNSQECQQHSMARTALTFLRWKEARFRIHDGDRAYLTMGGDAVAEQQGVVADTRYAVTSKNELSFRIEYRLPMRPDLYTLALLNCDGNVIHIEGESTFQGADGEKLSLPQVDVIRARIAIAVTTFVAASFLSILCFLRRTVTVPLQWLLAGTLLTRTLQQLLLMVPLIASSRDELLPRALSAPVEVVDTWEPVLLSSLLAEATSLIASLIFLSALLALAAGRHFSSPNLPPREQEVLVTSMTLYFTFGMLQAACTNEVSCGVFVLSFQVIRILFKFVIVLFINASVDRLRREHGHQWEQLFPELLRLSTLLAVRRRIILVYLILPILFMFLEIQVLGWQAIWFKRLWRECLELYLVLAVAWRILPSSSTYVAHFRWLRPSPTSVFNTNAYARFFRFILGSSLDPARADSTVMADQSLAVAAGRVPLRLNDRAD